MNGGMRFAAAGIMLLVSLAGSTSSAAAEPAYCNNPVLLAATLPPTIDLSQCDIRNAVILDGSVGAGVPSEGNGILAFSLGLAGSESFGIVTSPEGVVHLFGVGVDPLALPSPPNASMSASATSGEDTDPSEEVGPIEGTECTDDYKRLLGTRVSGQHQWYFNIGSVSAYLDPDRARSRIREGGSHITHFKTDCSYRVQVSSPISIAYQGTTTRGTNMSYKQIIDSVVCNSRGDGVSVVGFGNLDAHGLTCYWLAFGNIVTESDIRFNHSRQYSEWFDTNALPDPCSGRLDLEGIATHERGHTFGLADIPWAEHPYLTMREAPVYCSRELRSLGLGDLKGLDEIY